MRTSSILLAAVSGPLAEFVGATWSIIATDRETGEVGVAAVTCRGGNNNRIPKFDQDYHLEPGKFVVAAQAFALRCQAEFTARYYNEESGEPEDPELTPEEGIAFFDPDKVPPYDARYDPPELNSIYGDDPDQPCDRVEYENGDQNALVDMSDSYVYMGSAISRNACESKGQVKGDIVYSIQGNDLDNTALCEAANVGFSRAFSKAGKSKSSKSGRCELAERLMQGLLAGNEVGGDKDCEAPPPDGNGATSTNIYYFSVLDQGGNEVLGKTLFMDTFNNNENPVKELEKEFNPLWEMAECKKPKRYLKSLKSSKSGKGDKMADPILGKLEGAYMSYSTSSTSSMSYSNVGDMSMEFVTTSMSYKDIRDTGAQFNRRQM